MSDENEDKELTGIEKRVANLKPMKKGETGRNPWGRAGNPENRKSGRDAEYVLTKKSKFKDPYEFLVAVYSGDNELLGLAQDEEISLSLRVSCAKEAVKYVYQPLKAKDVAPEDAAEGKFLQTPIIVIPSNERDPQKLLDSSREALRDLELNEAVFIDLPSVNRDE